MLQPDLWLYRYCILWYLSHGNTVQFLLHPLVWCRATTTEAQMSHIRTILIFCASSSLVSSWEVRNILQSFTHQWWVCDNWAKSIYLCKTITAVSPLDMNFTIMQCLWEKLKIFYYLFKNDTFCRCEKTRRPISSFP